MQITGTTPMAASEPRIDRPTPAPFRPITSEDLTVTGIMRRITEQNLGTSVDLQA
ncbi:hypothetical protein D3C72_1919800 [compost metagenome]